MIPRLPRGFTHPVYLAQGAFSTIYRTRQAALDRRVAVKILHEKDPARKQQLLEEATTQARIEADCIPRVYDAFIYRGRVHIVMQWVRGVSLANLLNENLSDTQRLWIVDRLVGALSTLHNQGFAHRDVKPENIIIAPGRGLFLVDFGFARNMMDAGKSMAGTVKGTPAYMAPELWQGTPDVDFMRADLWSAGKVIAEVLPGERGREIAGEFCREDPADRPPNMTAGARLWKEYLGDTDLSVNERTFGDALTAAELSDRLYHSARRLLAAGRDAEAYWLLVECLEEHPDHARAVELMATFSRFVRKKKIKRAVTTALAAAIALCIVSVAFLLGRTSSRWERIEAVSGVATTTAHSKIRTYVRGGARGELSRGKLPLMHEKAEGGSALGGTVVFERFPAAGTVFCDGREISAPAQRPYRLSLSHGTHRIVWKKGDAVSWKERITLLPFEEKRIALHRRDRGETP